MADRRIEIRNMFVSMSPKYGSTKYDVAILTPTDGYIEYEFGFAHNRLSNMAFDTIRSWLVDYRLTPQTEVCYIEGIHDRNPLVMYMDALAQQIGFTVRTATVKQMSNRLCGIIDKLKKKTAKSSSKSRIFLQQIWEYILESGGCNWITPEYDEYLVTLNQQQRGRKKLVRIGAYYMRKRRLKYEYTLRSKLRRAERLAAQAGA